MAFKVSFAIALATLLAVVMAPSGSAAGVRQQRVAEPARQQLAAPTPLIAPALACPGQANLDAPVEVQEKAMRCMTDFARLQAGLEEFAEADTLDQSARAKSDDILRCDSFSHFACGRRFSHWIREAGYMSVPCWRVGENIAWGRDEYGTVRSIFQAWMRSPGHRENILGEFEELGLSLRVGALGKRTGTRVWTQHFGAHCDS